VNELRGIGIAPDMLMCRSEGSLSQEIRKKIALFASLPVSAIVSACDVDNIYKVPLTFREQGVDDFILEHFGVEALEPDLASWTESIERAERAGERAELAERVGGETGERAGEGVGERAGAGIVGRASNTVRIAIVGKYVQLEDAYLSVSEALRHAAALQDASVRIEWVDSERLEGAGAHSREDRERARELLSAVDGILIPGGFGGRGIEGKIAAAQIAREQRVPYLGICLGMQVAVAEFARHVAGMEGANSTEFDLETPFPVIDLLPEQKEIADLGGTMRLGADPIKLHEGSRARAIYGEAVVYERHRHRYEVNNLLRRQLQNAGLGICGTSPDERLVETIELPEHPFFVASQFHPEFKSRPERPAPLFREFVAAALLHAGERDEQVGGEPAADDRSPAGRQLAENR